MSVHLDRGAWVVRWRQDGQQRARRVQAEPEPRAFDEGISAYYFVASRERDATGP